MTEGNTPLTQREKMRALWNQQPNQRRFEQKMNRKCMVDQIMHGEPPCKSPVFSGPALCIKHAGMVARIRGVREYRRPEPLPVDPQIQEANRKVIALQNEALRLKSEIRRLKAIKEPEPAPERPRPQRPEHGHIYFLLSDNAVKIGWTSDLEQRMKSYSPGTKILAVMPGARKDETRLHRKFAHLRTNRREWFAYSPQVMEEVERIVKEHGDPPRDLNEPVTTTRIVGPRLTNYTQRRARSLGK